MQKKKLPVFTINKIVFVRFIGSSEMKMARYKDISIQGFSCYSNKKIDPGEKFKIEMNLKMISGGAVDDVIPHIAVAEAFGNSEVDGKIINEFKYVSFAEGCFENLEKVIDRLDKIKEGAAPQDIKKIGQTKKVRRKSWDIIKNIAQQVKEGKVDIPVLPEVVQNVQRVLRQPDSTADDLAAVIEKDAAMTVKIIGVANSPFYSGREKTRVVREAIGRLGLKEIRDIVLTISTKNLYKTNNRQLKKLLEKIWEHSIACANCARAIAVEIEITDADRFFPIGLVHDIGKTVLIKKISEMTTGNESFDMADVMAGISEYNSSLSGVILRHWRFSKDYLQAAVFHEGYAIGPATSRAVLIINLANHLAGNMGYGITDDKVDISGLESRMRLGLDGQSLDRISEEVKKILEDSANVF